MKKLQILIPSIALIILLSNFSMLQAYPTGIVGRTKKNSTVGCGGGCHSNNTSITCVITGPDTVTAGQNATYTIAITRTGSNAGAGCNIAVKLGTLAPGTGLKLQTGELTHTAAWTLSGGTVSRTFTYTAPAAAGTDTIWSIGAVGYSNGFNWGAEKRIIVRVLSGITNNETPVKFALNQNFPNPFNPSTTISFEVSKVSLVNLSVYDVNGRKVDELANGNFTEGKHEIVWDATSYPSGIYYYELTAGDIRETKKMILVK